MKKSLVLAMAMALRVTASAYAANPFSDVPAGHWAYDSISKLAAAGVIEGYGDDTFRGDRLMTRYEMAQIVAKAMAKGANVDKLAAEFADELDALDVRVAALEKKADNVKITGQVRYRYYTTTKRDAGEKKRKHDLRSRIFINGQVNDSWAYTAWLQNVQDFTNNIGDETTSFQRAWVNGRLGGVKVTAGRWQPKLGDGVIYDSRMDGVGIGYDFGKVGLNAYYGKPSASTKDATYTYNEDEKKWDIDGAWTTPYDEMFGVSLAAKFGKVGLDVGYDVFRDAQLNHGWNVTKDKRDGLLGNVGDDNKIFNVGLKAEVVKDLNLGFRYLHTSEKVQEADSKNGYVVDLGFKGATAAKPGSWVIAARYMDVGGMIPMAYTDDNSPMTVGAEYVLKSLKREGWKGYEVKASYTFAKNIIGTVAYYDWKGKVSDNKNRTFGGHLIMTF